MAYESIWIPGIIVVAFYLQVPLRKRQVRRALHEEGKTALRIKWSLGWVYTPTAVHYRVTIRGPNGSEVERRCRVTMFDVYWLNDVGLRA